MTKEVSELHHLNLGASLGEAVLALDGIASDLAINQLIGDLFADLPVKYIRADISESIYANDLCCPVSAETYYLLTSRNGQYREEDLKKLNALVSMTARLFSTKARIRADLQQSLQQQLVQAQILDQIHESVITMDLAGFILSWNKGAERLFGYTAEEAIGRNVLFLYDQESTTESDDYLGDAFLESGGRELEVRRKKKNGEVFWASLTLTLLSDQNMNPVGMAGYLSDITARKLAEEKINHLAYFDPLTGLPNRNLFKQLVDQALIRSLRSQSRHALLFIDLNRFKPVNDTLGHANGDILLCAVADRLRLVLRDEDIVARLGSDEFAIAIHDLDREDHARFVAHKVLNSLEAPFFVMEHELRLSASVGISVYPADGDNAETLLQKADIAMYKAKRSASGGSGGYAFYTQTMNAHIADRMLMEANLRKALVQNEFFLEYQPRISVASKHMTGAEALIRWMHPTRGLMSPAEFIQIAEETGLILQIGQWVLETACKQAKEWQEAGRTPFRVAVNISAKEFTTQLPVRIQDLLNQYDLGAEWLEIEITESMLMHSAETVIEIMEQIVALGVTLSLDDFGTGYSSLSYLKRFPISALKIDRSFVQGIPADASDCAIANAIVVMAHQLNLKVIAEGVETRQQLAYLSSASCDEIQGFLFSKPLSVQEIEQQLDDPSWGKFFP